jgi:hypothetical protein
MPDFFCTPDLERALNSAKMRLGERAGGRNLLESPQHVHCRSAGVDLEPLANLSLVRVQHSRPSGNRLATVIGEAQRVLRYLFGIRGASRCYAAAVHATAELCLSGSDFGEEQNRICLCKQPP